MDQHLQHAAGDATAWNAQLWALLGERALRYTAGDSASVPEETARELLDSIRFCIEQAADEQTGALVTGGPDAAALFRQGLAEIDKLVAVGREMLADAERIAPPFHHRSLRDTLSGIALFFRCYDPAYFAHQIPGEIDYQLTHEVPASLRGIHYINEYLRRLRAENEFLARFDPARIQLRLRAEWPDWPQQLFSVYEPVAGSALALRLLGGDVMALDVGEGERRLLWERRNEASRWGEAAEALCDELDVTDSFARAYHLETARKVALRCAAAASEDALRALFPPLRRPVAAKAAGTRFVDGARMDDAALRALLEEMGPLPLDERLAAARNGVHSLRDLAEVLDVCFWGTESAVLLAELGPEEQGFLWQLAAARREQPTPPDWVGVLEDLLETQKEPR